ncbi:17-beta-hydroxysteroid dehydrogenase type 2 [Antennarius striatus]|uniref:17-beta-hydroxysteroid dehydrogenase type 2 n=1 Tax=Antennarius striatus TaxID=241820 RepID=UPI0035B0951A
MQVRKGRGCRCLSKIRLKFSQSGDSEALLSTMETSCCFCVIAAVIFIFTLLRWLGAGNGVASWTLVGALAGASLYFVLPPGVCGAVLLGWSFILIHQTDRRAEMLPVGNRAVLVTGCDSGFGHTLAKRLSGMGVMVFAGVLDVNGPGAQQLRERASKNLQVLQLDVTDDSQIEAAHRYVQAQVGHTGLWGLVNNAGVLQCPMDAELQPISNYRLCLDVNFLGAVKMCQVFLPLLRRSKGRVVNVSSMSGVVPFPLFAAYGSSKAALSIFTQVLRLELSLWGVKVVLIEPSGFRTNLFGSDEDVARYKTNILTTVASGAREDYGDEYLLSFSRRLSAMPHEMTADLSPVVDDLCHGLLSVHPKPHYAPGKKGWFLPFLHRCCPTTVFDGIIVRTLKHNTDCKPAGISST